jgi:hypothetical protein
MDTYRTVGYGTEHHIKEVAMNKQQIKEALRQVVKEEALRQWKGGDLAIDYLTQSPGQERRDVLEGLAADVGLDYANLDSWERVARAWPENTRDLDYPWTLYRDYWRREDRFTAMAAYIAYAKANGITSNHYRRSQEFDGRKPTTEFSSGRAVEQAELALKMMPAADAARIAREVLTRPETAMAELPKLLEEVAASKPGVFYQAFKESQSVRRALDDAWRRDAQEHNRLLTNHHNDTLRRFEEGDAVLDLIEAANEFSRKVDEIVLRLGVLPDERARGLNLGGNRMLTSSLEAADAALAKVRAFVTTGRSDLDSFLGSVLRGAKS